MQNCGTSQCHGNFLISSKLSFNIQARIFHEKSSSLTDHLLSKVVFQKRSSSSFIEGSVPATWGEMRSWSKSYRIVLNDLIWKCSCTGSLFSYLVTDTVTDNRIGIDSSNTTQIFPRWNMYWVKCIILFLELHAGIIV